MTLVVGLTGEETLAPDFVPVPIQSPFTIPSPAAVTYPITPVATSSAAAPSSSGLPQFEKANVTKTEIKISGACTIETFCEVTVGLDDRVRAVGEFRVAKILHYVNKEGDVVRQQVLAPIGELVLSPWDSTDPTDDGIVRVRP